MRFLDSSAVVKLYVREEMSAEVRDRVTGGRCAVSRLAEVEVPSAFSRGVRGGVLSEKQGEKAWTAFRCDMRRWDVVELSADVVGEANRFLWRHPLRAVDAIQLGTALVLERATGAPLECFVAFDERLLAAARAERLSTFPE